MRQLGGLIAIKPATNSGALLITAKAIGREAPCETRIAGALFCFLRRSISGAAQSSGVSGWFRCSFTPQPSRSGASKRVVLSEARQQVMNRSQNRLDRPTPMGCMRSRGDELKTPHRRRYEHHLLLGGGCRCRCHPLHEQQERGREDRRPSVVEPPRLLWCCHLGPLLID